MANFPHFVHIGFPKTASTWLQEVFGRHPEICFLYKPKFFHWDDCFLRGKEFYQSLFQPKAGNKILLDSDEVYSVGRHFASFGWDCRCESELGNKFILPSDNSLIAHRIHDTVPEAKILMVIRNQVDWLASVYKHCIRKKEFRSFRKFLNSPNAPHFGKEYASAGFYSSAIELYFKLFGKENVLVLFYEELLSNSAGFLDKISDFFGISKFDYNQINRKTKISLTNRGAKIIQKINYLRFPPAVKPISYLDRKLFRKLKDPELISLKDREYLINLYTEDNKKLAKLLNLNYIDVWRDKL